MAAVFAPLFLLGLALAAALPVSSSATARLAVNGPPGAVAGEIARLQSADVMLRAISRFPVSRTYPHNAGVCGAGAEGWPKPCRTRMLDAFAHDLYLAPGEGAGEIAIAYAHPDPDTAVEVLNAYLGAYLNSRNASRSPPAGPAAADPETRTDTERETIPADKRLAEFLAGNGIRSFPAEMRRVETLYADVSSDLLRTEVELGKIQEEISALRERLASTPETHETVVERGTPQRLLDLRLEREELLTRYQPQSPPVRDLDERIARLEAYIAGEGGPAATVRNVPNPVFQTLSARRDELLARSRALTVQQAKLSSLEQTYSDRLGQLATLQPEYRVLLAEQEEARRPDLRTPPEQAAASGAGLVPAVPMPDVRISRPASAGTRSVSRDRAALLAFLVALAAALLAGLAKAFNYRRFPTAGSVQRTLGLPVLASVRQYR